MKFPTLTAGNAAIEELRDWLEGQRESARDQLEGATDMTQVSRLQGRAELLAEMLGRIDPERRPLAGVSSRPPKGS